MTFPPPPWYTGGKEEPPMKILILLAALCVCLAGCFPPGRPAMSKTAAPTQAQTEVTAVAKSLSAGVPEPSQAQSPPVAVEGELPESGYVVSDSP